MKRLISILLVLCLLTGLSAYAFSFTLGSKSTVTEVILPFNGRVFCGSADGARLLVSDMEKRVVGIYDVSGGEFTGLKADESLRDALITALALFNKQHSPNADLSDYADKLDKTDTQTLLDNAWSILGPQINTVCSVNGNIAVCLCLNGGYAAAIDLSSGIMYAAESEYQTPDGRLLTGEGLYDVRTGEFSASDLAPLADHTAAGVVAGVFTGEDSGCFLVREYSGEEISYYLVCGSAQTVSDKQLICSGSFMDLHNSVPDSVYVSADGTVCVCGGSIPGCAILRPDGEILYFTIDGSAKKCAAGEKWTGKQGVTYYGLLSDGRLLGLDWYNKDLFTVDTQTLKYTVVLNSSKLPGNSASELTRAALFADKLYYSASGSTGYITFK